MINQAKGGSFISQKNRLVSLVIIIGIFLVFYGGYLFYLQVLKGTEFKRRAEEVSRRITPIPAQRGEIYDRNYNFPLVLNIDSFAVDIIPGELSQAEYEDVKKKLTGLLNMSEQDIQDKVPQNYKYMFQPIEIKSGVDYNTISWLAEHINEFPGITWHNKPIRSYVETGSIAHVLGYVGSITREELQILYNQGYGVQTELGKNGIEKQYDMVLRGEDGMRFRTVDVRGRNIDAGIEKEISPVLGKNIVLTIDMNIQQLSEKALGKRNGSVLVLKPATGEILAMVSYPWYDANIFNSGNGNAEYNRISLDPNFPFLNRTIQSSYSPASMFKIVMTTAAIEDEVIPLDKTILCEGKMPFGDRVFHCWKKTGHGRLNLFQGIAESCNIFFFTLGTEYLGIERIVDFSHRYGLGELSGIDIPGEVPGLLPSPNWKETAYHSRWVGGDTMNISIGQGFLSVTPLQVANLLAMVVNNGVVFRPHLLKEVRDPISGNIISVQEPEIIRRSNISKETFASVRKAMRGVIGEGTAKVVITTDAVDIAGKTGTGEVGLAEKWNSWFTAYGPYEYENPEDTVV
ncbi:MAG: penicillin-binding protein 2, partial [Spirochaetales bacterium]